MSEAELTKVYTYLDRLAVTLNETRLTVAKIEERLVPWAQTQEALWRKINATEERIIDLEKHQPTQKLIMNWVIYAVWGAAGMFVMHLIDKVQGAF